MIGPFMCLSENWPRVRAHMCKSARGLNRAQSWVESAEAAVSSHNNHSPPICLFPDAFSLFLRRITFYMICSINLSIAHNNSSLIRALAILAVSSEPFCGVCSAVIQFALLMACLCHTGSFWYFGTLCNISVKWSLTKPSANHRRRSLYSLALDSASW